MTISAMPVVVPVSSARPTILAGLAASRDLISRLDGHLHATHLALRVLLNKLLEVGSDV